MSEILQPSPDSEFNASADSQEELDSPTIESLPATLGFAESEEMKMVRLRILASSDPDYKKECLPDYAEIGEQIAEQAQGESHPRARTGLMITIAMLKNRLGMKEAYVADLEHVLDYAYSMRIAEVEDLLNAEISKYSKIIHIEKLEVANSIRQISELLRGYGEDYGFDLETCQEIARMPFAEAYETAYSYLTQAGLDADEILRKFIEF